MRGGVFLFASNFTTITCWLATTTIGLPWPEGATE